MRKWTRGAGESVGAGGGQTVEEGVGKRDRGGYLHKIKILANPGNPLDVSMVDDKLDENPAKEEEIDQGNTSPMSF